MNVRFCGGWKKWGASVKSPDGSKESLNRVSWGGQSNVVHVCPGKELLSGAKDTTGQDRGPLPELHRGSRLRAVVMHGAIARGDLPWARTAMFWFCCVGP